MKSEPSPSSAQAPFIDQENYEAYTDIDLNEAIKQTKSRNRRIYLLAFFALLLSLVIFIAATHNSTKTGSLKYDQCGTTADEARSRGCVFEMTGFSWLPPECTDPETEENFLAHMVEHGVKWHHDVNLTEEVSFDEVKKGEKDQYFVGQAFHRAHCAFNIQKLHRALDAGKMLDGLIDSVSHTEHCLWQLLQPDGYRKDHPQRSVRKFPYCGKPGGYNVRFDHQGRSKGWTDY